MTWTSSDENVATVQNGEVTGVVPGTAGITVATEDGSYTASCAVTVTEVTSEYTISAPTTLTVQSAGWNVLPDGISVTGSLFKNELRQDTVTVSAASANGWTLKTQSGDAAIGYTLKSEENGDAKTDWELASVGTQGLGITVDDYSNSTVGTYTDTITFTVATKITKNGTSTLQEKNAWKSFEN